MQVLSAKPQTLAMNLVVDPYRRYRGETVQKGKATVDMYIALLSSGVSRALAPTPNAMLTTLFPRSSAPDASGQIAESVYTYLRTRKAMPALSSNFGRYQLGLKRDARWMFSGLQAKALLEHVWSLTDCDPVLVEGSPLLVAGKSARSGGGVRQTHHFVMVKFSGGVYVVDGVRGMVFDSLAAYLDEVMLPGYWGQSANRMKWFRVFGGGRETAGGITDQDNWAAPAV